MGDPLKEWDQTTNNLDMGLVFHSRHNCADDDCA